MTDFSLLIVLQGEGCGSSAARIDDALSSRTSLVPQKSGREVDRPAAGFFFIFARSAYRRL
jgi:hypothetical protein